jgi:hypothetical protein
MPIRKDLRTFYKSPEWRAIRAHILKRAGAKCEACAKPDRVLLWVTRDGTGRWYMPDQKPREPGLVLHLTRCVLTVAHLNHDTYDNRDTNLAALCQYCHLKHDRRFHLASARRMKARRAGQAWLCNELENANAPGAAWEERTK